MTARFELPEHNAALEPVRRGNGTVAGGGATGEDVRLTLLDEFRLESGNVYVHLPRTVQRIVAYLGLFPPQPRSLIAGTMWPDATEQRAGGSLRSAIWRLQKLCPRLLISYRDGLALAPHVQVDVHDFVLIARQLLTRAHTFAVLPSPAVLWRELLPGWYEDWVLDERDQLRQLRLHALEELADQLIQREQFASALEASLKAASIEPLRESAHRMVARAYLAEGNRAEAVRQYEKFRFLIRDELGLSPTPKFMQLLREQSSPADNMR